MDRRAFLTGTAAGTLHASPVLEVSRESADLVSISLEPSAQARLLLADDSPRARITRAIPGTGEQLPVVGLGSSASFSRIAGEGDVARVREVLDTLVAQGGRVFDTAPGYGASEELAGSIVREAGLGDRVFWATKLNVVGRGGGTADPAAARAQVEQSLARVGKNPIDLIQVHNMADVPTQLGVLREYKDAGRVRYVGVTTTSPRQYADLERLMRGEPLEDYKHKNLGTVASLGLGKGVANVGGLKLRGPIAWFMHRTYHMWAMPTFNRKVRIVLDWTV